MMKNTIKIMLILFLMTATQAKAQYNGRVSPEQKEKLEALKVAFLTKELSLTSQEAQTFWPLYNEMDDKLSEIRANKKTNIRNTRKNFETLSDSELENAVTAALNLQQEEITLKRNYLDKFKKVLPMKKVAKLYASEEKFKRKLLKMMKDKNRTRNSNGH